MGNKYKIILSREELKRITIKEENIIVDVHGLKTLQAKILLTNLIALENRAFTLDVIHGYNHGSAIRQMLGNTMISKRVTHIEHPIYNQGESLLHIDAAI